MILQGLYRTFGVGGDNPKEEFLGLFSTRDRAVRNAVGRGCPDAIREPPHMALDANGSILWVVKPTPIDGTVSTEVSEIVRSISSSVQEDVYASLVAHYGSGDHGDAAADIANRAIRSAWSELSDLVWKSTPIKENRKTS